MFGSPLALLERAMHVSLESSDPGSCLAAGFELWRLFISGSL
jgi:hypothetical protein